MKNNTAAAPAQPQPAGPTPARQADRRRVASWLCAAGLLLAWPVLAWEPSAAVELVVPAGAGGGADQMARLIQQTVTEHKLMRQPLSVVNRPGNSGIDGLMELKAARGNPHKLLISLSNLFTAPLAAGAAVEGRSAQMMAALDGLNARFGRGTVQLAAALGPKGAGPVPWQGQAAWRTPAYTTRLEDLMMVN